MTPDKDPYKRSGQRNTLSRAGLAARAGVPIAIQDAQLESICTYADGPEVDPWREWRRYARIAALAEIERRWNA